MVTQGERNVQAPHPRETASVPVNVSPLKMLRDVFSSSSSLSDFLVRWPRNATIE